MKLFSTQNDLIEKVVARLLQRNHLANTLIAKKSIIEHLLREMDVTGPYCGVTQPGSDLFVCNNTFSCVQPFMCNQGEHEYSGCGITTGSFQCNQTDTPSFSCEQGGSVADYFDCQTFDCGVNGNGNSEKFDCNNVVDFLCPGEDYDCVDDFDCTAGHGFFCTNHHDCEDQFTCSGGTTSGCGNPPVPVSCSPGPNVNGYSGNPGGDGNNDPGDFMCSLIGVTNDTFNCDKNFECRATSDFSCQSSGEFVCAQQSNGGSDEFRCNSTTEFECFDRFECASINLFSCDRPNDDPYNCKSSYAECVSKTDKECKKDYQCKSNHGCPSGASSTDHECNASSFTCQQGTSSTYNCANSIPAYSGGGG
jgi:hypothetical protein